MKKLTLLLPVVIICIGISSAIKAQDVNFDNHNVTIVIPEVSLLDIEPSSNTSIQLDITVDAPAEAGNPVNFSDTDNTLWLNYTSIVDNGETRTVTVAITPVIPGVDLKVQAGSYSGSGIGTTGTPAGSALILSATAQDIITGIGSCYTGNGVNNGHNLTYSLDLPNANFGNIYSTAGTAVSVTYTMTPTD